MDNNKMLETTNDKLMMVSHLLEGKNQMVDCIMNLNTP